MVQTLVEQPSVAGELLICENLLALQPRFDAMLGRTIFLDADDDILSTWDVYLTNGHSVLVICGHRRGRALRRFSGGGRRRRLESPPFGAPNVPLPAFHGVPPGRVNGDPATVQRATEHVLHEVNGIAHRMNPRVLR